MHFDPWYFLAGAAIGGAISWFRPRKRRDKTLYSCGCLMCDFRLERKVSAEDGRQYHRTKHGWVPCNLDY